MNPSTSDKLTPLVQQYRDAKAEAPADAILMFRIGDFYEMYGEDAQSVAGSQTTARSPAKQRRGHAQP